MAHWEALANYKDGFAIGKDFPYPLNDKKDDEQQHELEEWLLQAHDGCEWYSVEYVSEDSF